MKFTYFFIICTLLLMVMMLFNCSQNASEKLELNDFYNSKFDTLKMEADIDDYGEWGGHQEVFKLFWNTNNQLRINYYRDSITDPTKGTSKRWVVENWERTITHKDIEAFEEYLSSLTLAAIRYEGMSNGGCRYSVRKTSSDFHIEFNNYGSRWPGFQKLYKKVNTQNKLSKRKAFF
jgi:hypothetical protein